MTFIGWIAIIGLVSAIVAGVLDFHTHQYGNVILMVICANINGALIIQSRRIYQSRQRYR